LEDFARCGVVTIPTLIDAAQLAAVCESLAQAQLHKAGTRNLLRHDWCTQLARKIQRNVTLAALIPGDFAAVQCTYFAKSAEQNWLVSLHQDLSIPVAERVRHPELSGWSEKEGVPYVHAPIEVLERLIAVRLHIDDCGPDDGPLRVIPGSHVHGKIDLATGADIRGDCDETLCTGDRGDGVVMRPLLLHASSKARGTSQRRVLHFLYGPRTLPRGLRWHHVA
jgi:Phytanoyl-CoA dioxygenase (PhyH)